MLKRQKEGESMGTPAQVEAAIAVLTAAHPGSAAQELGYFARSAERAAQLLSYDLVGKALGVSTRTDLTELPKSSLLCWLYPLTDISTRAMTRSDTLEGGRNARPGKEQAAPRRRCTARSA